LSAQAGVAHLGGGRPPAGLARELLDALEPLPAERLSHLEARGAEFGCWTRWPAAAVAQDGPLGVVLDGHLDGAGDGPDAVLRGYAAHRERCPAQFAGHFALAVWDERARRLLLVRDPAGCRPLFYARDGDLLLWASSVGALLAVRPRLKVLNERLLAFHLAGVEPADQGHTAWERVRRLPAEHLAVAENGTVRTRRYSDLVGRPRTGDPATASRDLADALGRAVGRAVRGHEVAVAMSGGMDSTSVAVMIGEGSPLLISMGYRHSPELDESALIDAVSERLGHQHDYVYIDDAWPLSDYPRSYSANGDLPPLFGGLGWSRVMRRAHERGASVLLTGHGGDSVLAYSPIHHIELFRGPLRHALAETVAYRRSHGEWPSRELRTALAMGLRRHAPVLFTVPPLSPLARDSCLLTPELIRSTGIVDDLRAQTEMLGRAAGRERLLRLSFGHQQQRVLELMVELGTQNGVELRHPFLDAELLAYATSLPERAVFRGGVRKRPLRDAMSGRLPDDVRRSFRATPITGLFRHGYGPEGRGAEVKELLRDPLLARMGLVRPERLRRAYERFMAGDRYSLGRLNAGIVAELWLRHKLGEPLPGSG
jgi:asparagine synthase (glutamine-hydrolysing)